MRPIAECVKAPRKTPAEEVEGSGDDGDIVVLGSDVEGDDHPVVDTDEESDVESTVGSETSSDASIAEEKAKAMKQFLNIDPVPKPPAKLLATGDDKAYARSGLAALWSDEYFWIRDIVGEILHVKVRGAVKQSLGGTAHMSKQVTPRDLGEKRSQPVRSLLVLRAWVLWRVHRDGWAHARSCRRKHFAEHATLLERDVKSLKAPCRLLGHYAANAAFVEAAPAIAARRSSHKRRFGMRAS